MSAVSPNNSLRSPVPSTPMRAARQQWRPFHRAIVRIGSHQYVKAMLATVPIGIITAILGGPPRVVFVLNLTALIPLVTLLTISIADLSMATGRVVDELLKATVGNAIELTLGVVAMASGQMHMIHSTLIGSMLCYMLLVPGSCFCLTGYDKDHLHFDRTLISIMSSLMVAVCMSLLIPTIMVTFPSLDTTSPQASVTRLEIVFVSRAAAIVLLILLGVLLLFQLKSHASIFDHAEASSEGSPGSHSLNDRGIAQDRPARIFAPRSALIALVTGVSCLIMCILCVVKSADRVAQELGLSAAFPALVLVPLVGNSTRYVAIVIVSRQGHAESAVRAIINNILRITLLVIPVLIILGWVLNLPITLQMDTFEATMLFLASMVLIHVLQNGKSNYFEGLMLVGTYVISVAAFYMRPGIAGTAKPTP
ncbi:vacuolar calcium ion transporter [Aspergillus nomiae NRRL 13137]|uniref:Vacuolar calcium ion transporter n=1 Tax=Aspergillus nomiae NRRL (strain ATCC 15546 / NRRL 13137 / CBS 260.88 / M93) TaxID=1509407 RepID=A0A0L1JI21_ASPN3|nr:vacuolar calcium ion transporter [Aspergillus nomiae NRRL 13137]KNG91028.1 vacuolar calcium ion transporter [Aspergillus nomiae NRRL 13137]